ncbi:hypothetical protein MLD38_013271 [Melastoma candidum]|uniref:Uncharacterized protein n=1 Tax=Melastoma candidum TaxID=119954 RepID=A0ACB9R9N0_9MYRT|nr:hypothetical protein MLD38_013271 [Melastoma candidum]
MDERAHSLEKKETTFDPQILIEKLAKLNLSQASIETLSYWCIFHMNNAKYVVDTWEREFHCSPQEQRVAFLYLANDIMQNSRKKGIEFVNEFGRVLPDALHNVVHNGDDFGRNAAYRLLNIWEERKVFDSHVELLTEEFKRRLMNGANQNRKDSGARPKKPVGNILDKIVSCYQVVRGGQKEEEVIVAKCRGTVSVLEKMEKDAVQNNLGEGVLGEASFLDNMQGQHAMLKNSIEQLAAVESSRARLVTCLRDALQEQEFKLRHVHDLLQVARSRSEKMANICRNLGNGDNKQLPDQHDNSKDVNNSDAPLTFAPIKVDHSSPAMHPLQPPYREMSGQLQDEKKPDIAIMSTKLTALTSSSQLSSVLTSLASEGVIGNPRKDSCGEYPPEKRSRLDNGQFTFQDSESPNGALQPPLPPTSAPPIPPPPPGPPSVGSMAPFPSLTAPHFMQVPPGMPAVTFTYGVGHHQPPPPPGPIPPFPVAPANACQSFPGPDGPYYAQGQPSSVPMASMPHQLAD